MICVMLFLLSFYLKDRGINFRMSYLFKRGSDVESKSHTDWHKKNGPVGFFNYFLIIASRSMKIHRT